VRRPVLSQDYVPRNIAEDAINNMMMSPLYGILAVLAAQLPKTVDCVIDTDDQRVPPLSDIIGQSLSIQLD